MVDNCLIRDVEIPHQEPTQMRCLGMWGEQGFAVSIVLTQMLVGW